MGTDNYTTHEHVTSDQAEGTTERHYVELLRMEIVWLRTKLAALECYEATRTPSSHIDERTLAA